MQIEDWINSLRSSEKLIIVEGKRDLIALRKLGIFNVMHISRSLYNLTEDISKKHKQVIILTDLDKEGQKIYKNLKHNLQRYGVKVDTKFREFLFKTRLRQIEGLVSYLKNLNISIFALD